MHKMHESKNNFEKLQMSTAINPFRGRPLEKSGGGVTIPKKNSCKGNLSERKILQAVILKKKIQAEEMTCLV